MSRLMSATICWNGTVGCAAKYCEPSSPFSSAVTARKITERFSLTFDSWSRRATSMMVAIPEASSMAPL